MNVIIVEDELPAARALEKLLRDADPTIAVATVAGSVAAAVAWFDANPAPDLAFMDIQLGDGLSFAIFEKTRVGCPVIFTTAYNEYAIRAFKLNSIDYLLKPVRPAELAHSLAKFKEYHTPNDTRHPEVDLHGILKSIQLQTHTYKTRFLVPYRDQFLSIPVEEISYFLSEHKNTFLVTREHKKFTIDSPLENIETELDPRVFFRVNRQFLVSYPAIAAVHSYFNGKLKVSVRGSSAEIIISRERAAGFKAWLDR